jgi:4'-phosphopantetheinyl transferase
MKAVEARLLSPADGTAGSWPGLTANDVHVWRAPLEPAAQALDRLAAWLSPEETDRSRRFRFSRDRHGFVAAHGFLRLAVSRYLGVDPCDLEFDAGASGKPRLADAGSEDLRFNLAHTDGMALIAVTRGREVGVDIERIKPGFDWAELAPRYFSAPERAGLDALPAPQRSRAGYEIWTRKEAWVKAVGTGLTTDLLDFGAGPLEGEPVWLGASSRPAAAAGPWTLCTVEAGGEYSAAVAVEGRQVVIHPVWALDLA